MDAASRSSRQWLFMVLWAVLLGLGGLIVARSLVVESDLRLFLPAAQSAEERILLEELKEGPGTRALLVALSGMPSEQLPSLSDRLASRLRENPAFTRVENGTLQSDPATQELLLRYRYLLSPREQGCGCDSAALKRELDTRLLELGSPAGALAEDLLLRDPSGEMQAIVDSWLPAVAPQLRDGVWFSRDGQQALLYLQTTAPGFDADRQRLALAALNEAAHAVDPSGRLVLAVTGTGAFTVLLEESVRGDVTLLGGLAGVGSVLFLLLVLRSLRHTLLGLLCLATTSLAAIVGVSLAFPSVHGITLAFGFTLLGVAMDYPVHLMLHLTTESSPRETLSHVWPTMRLSILTTCIAYLALILTGFTGLTQLGLFTICGLLATGVALRWVLPTLVSPADSCTPPAWLLKVDRLPRLPALPLVVLAVSLAALLISSRPLWSNELAGLTPVPQPLQDLDARLRSELGAPDLRYALAVRAADADSALQRVEALQGDLKQLVTTDVIGSFDSPSRLLPSAAHQRQVQQSLPDTATLRTRMHEALADSPFRDDAFATFFDDVEASRALAPLTPDALQGTPLADRLGAVLLQKPGEAIAMVTLSDVKDPVRLAAWAGSKGNDVLLLDLKSLAESLIARYRTLALAALGFALVVIAVVMVVQLRWRATLAVLLPVLATLAATVAVLNLGGIQLTLFHVVSLILVGGLSFDYGLFFNRSEATDDGALRTRYSVMVCWVSTLGAFALLMLSRMPVLQALGSTVTLGVTLGFVLSLLARHAEADAK
jgi:predicted exporter